MTLEILKDYQNLQRFFKKPGDANAPTGLTLLECVSRHINSIEDKQQLRDLIYSTYHKWPHTKDIEILRRVVKRYFQTKFYAEFYSNPIPQKVKKEDEKQLTLALFKDEPLMSNQEISQEVKQEASQEAVKQEVKEEVEEVKEVKQEVEVKQKTFKTEFAKKVSEMELADVVSWAREVKVSEDSIQKHIGKPLGLAKMTISNMIRGILQKDPANQHLWSAPQEK